MRAPILLLLTCMLTGLAAARDDEGAALYRAYCTQCHGVEGDGNGINAPHMAVQPRDHTDPSEMGTRTDEDLFKVIKHGGKAINKSVLMPAWSGNLNDEEIRALVTHLRSLCCNGRSTAAAAGS